MASVINQIKLGSTEYAIAPSAYAECSTGASTQAKVASIVTDSDTSNNAFTLIKGVSIQVNFTNANSAASPTLNVAGTGAKPIHYKGAVVPTTALNANIPYIFVYDGANWDVVGHLTAVTPESHTLAWNTAVKIATIDGTEIKAKLPANPNTDTSVTSAANHYTPSTNSGSALNVDASSTTSATWASTSLVTGVNLSRDSKGHVTGLTVDSIRMPANPDTNTTYSPGTNLSLSGTTFSTVASPTFSGTVTANTFNAQSDKRLKENLVCYESNNKSILELPIYKFDYINGSKNKIGCMAQDLQQVCPEIVHEDEKGYLAIEESKIVYLLLEEVKKLKAEVEELKAKV